MNSNARSFVTGHRGMVGSAIVRRLQAGGYDNLLLRTHAELDLLDQRAVHHSLAEQHPDSFFIAAAKLGSSQVNNQHRADFLYQKLVIETNLIHGAHQAGEERLMLPCLRCICPRDCPQSIKEQYLPTGPLEAANEPYAIAKIVDVKLCEATNVRTSCSTSAQCRPTCTARTTTTLQTAMCCWRCYARRKRLKNGDPDLHARGSGAPPRKFVYADDLADPCVFLMKTGYSRPFICIGTSKDLKIEQPAKDCDGRGGLRRGHRLRPQQARRYAAQAALCQPHVRFGLASRDRLRGWHRAALPSLSIQCLSLAVPKASFC
jgi:GDP-L-fucose synthase